MGKDPLAESKDDLVILRHDGTTVRIMGWRAKMCSAAIIKILMTAKAPPKRRQQANTKGDCQ